MTQLGPIVVGTDGSARADRAVDRAGELAGALKVTVHVVTAYGADSDGLQTAAAAGLPGSGARDDSERSTRARHSAERARQRLERLGVAAEIHVWPGEPADALVRIADEQRAQMIVVGNRGMTGARRVLGSVPNAVSHHAHCGVLIVPTD